MPPKPETFLALSHRGRGCESRCGKRLSVAIGPDCQFRPIEKKGRGKCDITSSVLNVGCPMEQGLLKAGAGEYVARSRVQPNILGSGLQRLGAVRFRSSVVRVERISAKANAEYWYR